MWVPVVYDYPGVKETTSRNLESNKKSKIRKITDTEKIFHPKY